MALATALPSDLSLGRTVTLSGSSPAGFNIFLGSLWPCPYLFKYSAAPGKLFNCPFRCAVGFLPGRWLTHLDRCRAENRGRLWTQAPPSPAVTLEPSVLRGPGEELGVVGKAVWPGKRQLDRSLGRQGRHTQTKETENTGPRRLCWNVKTGCTTTPAEGLEAGLRVWEPCLLSPSPTPHAPPPSFILTAPLLPCPCAPSSPSTQAASEAAHGGSEAQLQPPRRKALRGPPCVTGLPLVPSAMARSLLKKTGGAVSFLLSVATHACPDEPMRRCRRSPWLIGMATFCLPEAPNPRGRPEGSEKGEPHPGQPGQASTCGRRVEAGKLSAKGDFKIHGTES